MAQMFGQLPPPSLYQNNVRLTFHTDVESHSDEDPVAPRKDSESDPGELSDYTIGEDDEDTASGFGKIRPLPIPPRPKERSPVQSTYPYLSTLPDIVPLSPLRDAPFGQYPSRLIAPIEPAQRTTSRRPAPIRVMPDPPKSPRWIPEDETLSIAKQRRASISGMDILRESQHSQSRSHRNSRSGSHSANTSISSTMSTSSSVSDDLSFQARRKRATKLARFFGVEYNDIHAVDTNPLAPPSSQSSCDTSSSAASSSGSKAGFIGPPRGDEPVVSVPTALATCNVLNPEHEACPSPKFCQWRRARPRKKKL
ncbi:hypothetical protein BS47DRAFT_383037 [Hydnum rufescens UP504]|uniref:Uncharacterized protein n=1 Tax=Hydnum rufescens UP504 TaxID=1448309 RepID=A0A9P6AJ10_9AGAM|nr:hypothetical protein BS47DRAFT_383037 [Hydnum rufescens UP504]